MNKEEFETKKKRILECFGEMLEVAIYTDKIKATNFTEPAKQLLSIAEDLIKDAEFKVSDSEELHGQKV